MEGRGFNLTGIVEAITACFPQTEIQKCIVHQIRNSIRYVSYKDTKKLLANLKPIYTAPSEEAALLALEEFEKTWGVRYPLVVQSWQRNWGEIATFFKYPPEIRKLIYTTNMIESYHRQLRKVTKGKSVLRKGHWVGARIVEQQKLSQTGVKDMPTIGIVAVVAVVAVTAVTAIVKKHKKHN